jgi:hypothetical protein
MADINIKIRGTLSELEPLLNLLKNAAISKMDRARSIESAKKIWENNKALQKDPDFIEAKNNVKKRLS